MQIGVPALLYLSTGDAKLGYEGCLANMAPRSRRPEDLAQLSGG